MSPPQTSLTNASIAWARDNCPVPISVEKQPYEEAKKAYDAVDERLGDDAEEDEFLTKAMWMEITIRLAKLGWTVEELEDARWPVPHSKGIVSELIKKGV